VAAAEPQRDLAAVALKGEMPYKFRANVPDFPPGMTWLNSKPLTKKDLQGKFVLLDFWTYCCINCMHILPELKKLEHEFPNNLVVIGVHSAKFETEKVTENIRRAILRNEIEHPVVNDADHKIWDTYGVSSWPTAILIDPQGFAVWFTRGEFKADVVQAEINRGLAFYRDNKVLDERPFKLELESAKVAKTPLNYPGKILADEKGQRLFISDSNHNRIVIATLDGQLLDVIGSGEIGRSDGNFQTATFNHPQGCALNGKWLYVADTENHLLRKVDLEAKTVTIVAGTGEQGNGWPGLDPAKAAIGRDELPDRWIGPPAATALNSPWALWVHKQDLYIAMAGPHQIWKMPLDEREIGPYAGNGREDIVDGPLLPRVPYMLGFSSFAQPSGLSSDGTWLFVADSEGSSVRGVPFDTKKHVKTVIGSDLLDGGRLFAFGDKDGPRAVAKLQHCLEVVYVGPPANGKSTPPTGKIYVADTYNHKIKVVDANTGETKTIAGSGPGDTDDPPRFREPAGLAHAQGKLYVADTNNSLIRVIDLASGKVSTLTIAGLAPPAGGAAGAEGGNCGEAEPPPAQPAVAPPAPKKPSFKGAKQEKVQAASVMPVDGVVKLDVELKLPAGWHINLLAPMSYWLDSPRESGPLERVGFGRTKFTTPTARFAVPVKVAGAGEDEVQVSFDYYYCEDKDQGVCKTGSVVFTVPLKIGAGGSTEPVKLKHVVVD
jgi:DNA-binding beta-propeller fold protein YncE